SDEQRARLITDLSNRRPVTVPRREDSPGPDHGFAEERCNGSRPSFCHTAEGICVIPRHDHHRINQIAETGAVGLDPGEARAKTIHPVVGAFTHYNNSPRLADRAPIAANELSSR